MENNTQKIRFPVGALFMIAYAILLICKGVIVHLNFLMVINALCYLAFATLAIMKKKGMPMLVPIAGIALISLIGFSISDIPFLAILIFIALLVLDDMQIGNLSSLRSSFVKGVMVSVLLFAVLKVVLDTINVWAKPNMYFRDPWLVIIEYILLPMSMLLMGLWINDPYEKVKKIKEVKKIQDTDNSNEFYVSLGKHICLLIFTCGIWQMIWVYKTTQFTNSAKGEDKRNPTTTLLLYLFVPFYSIYWIYKSAQRIDAIAKDSGIGSDLGTVCLILAIFIGIVPPILMQDKINEITKKSISFLRTDSIS